MDRMSSQDGDVVGVVSGSRKIAPQSVKENPKIAGKTTAGASAATLLLPVAVISNLAKPILSNVVVRLSAGVTQ